MTGEIGMIGALLPEILLTVTLLVVLMLDAFRSGDSTDAMLGVTVLGVVAAGVSAIFQPMDGGTAFHGLIHVDGVRRYMLFAICVAGASSLLVSRDYLHRHRQPVGEALGLVLTSMVGMGIMVSTTHLGLMFLGLEMMSIPLYVLAAFRLHDLRSGEGAIKYFLLGSAAGAMFLFGAALVYGETGSLDTVAAFARVPIGEGSSGLQLGLVLMLTAVAFKLAWVPFHGWSPDAYEGAPAPWTAFMSTAVKVAIVGAAVRAFFIHGPLAEGFVSAISVLAILTMVAGNLLAMNQSSIKRMLAYSSVAHAGYIALAFIAGTAEAFAAAAFYLVVYSLMNVAAFGSLVALSRRGEELERFDDLRGLSRRHPGMAFVILLTFMSLAGLPPLGGFTAKLFLFSAAVDAGLTSLVILAVLMSVVGAWYYLRPAVTMYLEDGEPRVAETVTPWSRLVLGALALVLVLLGLLPRGLLAEAQLVFGALFGGA